MLALADAVMANAQKGPKMFRFHKVVQRVSKRFSPQIAHNWLGAVSSFKGGINETALRSALAARNAAQLEAAVGASNFGQAMRRLEDPFAKVAGVAGTASADVLEAGGFGFQFNAVDPNVVMFARDQSAALAVAMTDDVREAVRTVVALGAQEGLTIAQQARAIREVVGLPPNWVDAPFKFEAELRGLDKAALRRRLSATDKAQIRSRIKSGNMTESFVARMRERYSDSLTNRRALNIARTESLRAANFGTQESWEQGIKQGTIGKDSRRFWIVTADSRLSEEHSRIPSLNPNGRGMTEPFVTTEGLFMYPPSRPNCRCSIGLGVVPGTGVVAPPPALRQVVKKVAKKKMKRARKKLIKKSKGLKTTKKLTKTTVPKQPKVPAVKELDDAAVMAQKSKAYPKVKEDPNETMGRFLTKDGQYIPERQRLHDAIVRQHFEGVTVPAEQPQVLVMGGGPASGKSSVIRKFPNLTKNHVEIDVDHIRTLLPEYREGVEVGNKLVAALTHEESSYLGKRIAREAVKGRYNVMVDGTGDSSYAKLAQKVEGFRKYGHRVVGQYVSVDTDVAVARALARGQKTGRYVPETVIRETHKNVSSVLNRAVRDGLFDEVTLWDTNAKQMVKVAHALKDKVTIHAKAEWRRFLAKAFPEERLVIPTSVPPDPFVGYRGGPKLADALTKQSQGFGASLPAAQRSAVFKYEGPGYSTVQKVLRTDKLKLKSNKAVADVIHHVDDVLEKAQVIDEPAIFWRGGKFGELRVGDEFVDKAYTSLTTDLSTAESFTRVNRGNTLLRVGTPKGQRGLWTGAVTDDFTEVEFLLSRGAKFKVRRSRRLTWEEYQNEFQSKPSSVFRELMPDGPTIVDIEVIP